MKSADNWKKLYEVEIKEWVQRSVELMNYNQENSRKAWKIHWYEVFIDLRKNANNEVGEKDGSGKKGCPRCAAYGLWQLGYIVDSGQNVKKWNLQEIRNELGKNAVYAVLALEKLDEHKDIDIEELWSYVRDRYRQEKFPIKDVKKKKKLVKTKSEQGFEEPAKDHEGAVEIALALSKENLIIPLSLRK